MLFMVTGYLKPGAEQRINELHIRFNEHLAQPFQHLVAAGALRDRTGQRKAYVVFIEAEHMEQAERYLHESPFVQDDLYEQTYVFEYDGQIGRIG